MGIQLKIIAASDAPVQLSSNTALGFRGLASPTNEDANVDVVIRHSPVTTPSLNEVYRGGSMLVHSYGMQYQVQDTETGNTPSEYWLAALPFGPMPGDIIAVRSYVATPENSACTFVAVAFTLPALNGNVQITVLDTSDFSVGNYVDRVTNTGLFVGGRFWDIVSIDSGTLMTLKLRDVFGAVVIMLG
jgi:hypothetical protein